MTSEAPTGAWLFRYRSYLPVPLALVLVLVRKGAVDAPWIMIAGPLLVATGEGLRLWAVRHIGTISRTRTTRYGPLMTAGPYAIVRNPLYVGNWFLWTGFAVWSGLLWMLPIAWVVFALQYRAIARWEAAFIRSIYTSAYDAYAQRVRAWVPGWPAAAATPPAPLHPWSKVLFSERGTLIAVGIMSLLLTLRQTIVR
jgi:protein-S-isoprenylcysteine O-methyltransferase Ste14